MTRPDRISRYVEGHNEGRHPDPLPFICDRGDAAVIRLFHETRPPILDDDAVARQRAFARVNELLAEGEASASSELGAFLRLLRRRLGLTRRDLATRLRKELALPAASLAKLKHYYADLENGLLSAHRLAPELYEALARALATDPEELRGAARFSAPLARPEARAFARATRTARRAASPDEYAPSWDLVDALFLGGRPDDS